MTSKSRMATVAALFAVASLGACASTETSRSTGETVDDAKITATVKAALIDDETVEARDINVNTYRGEVQLSGFVDSPTMISRAGELARRQDGVRAVDNDLQVKAPG